MEHKARRSGKKIIKGLQEAIDGKVARTTTFTRRGLPPPPRLVISEWLLTCSPGQWTPFEAAGEIVACLRRAGYQIVPEKK